MNPIKYFIIFVLILGCFFLFISAQPTNLNEARELINKSKDRLSKGDTKEDIKKNIAEAITFFEKDSIKYHHDLVLAYQHLGVYYYNTKENQEAKKCFYQSVRLTKQKTDKDIILAQLYTSLGNIASLKERKFEEANKFYNLATNNLPIERNDTTLIAKYNIINGRGIIEYSQRKYFEAAKYFEEAKEILPNSEQFYAKHGQIYNNLYACAINTQQYILAEEYINKSIAIRSSTEPINYTSLVESYGNLAYFYFSSGLYYQSEETALKALNLKDSVHESSIGIIYHHLGLSYLLQNKLNKSIKYFEKEILLLDKYDIAPRHIVNCFLSLSSAYNNAKDSTNALLTINKALKIALHHKLDVTLSDIYINKGNIYYVNGIYKKAIENNKKASLAAQKSKNKINEAKAFYNIANIKTTQGKYQEALPFLQKVIALDKQNYQFPHSELGRSYAKLSLTYINLKKWKEAAKNTEQAFKALNITDENFEVSQIGNFNRSLLAIRTRILIIKYQSKNLTEIDIKRINFYAKKIDEIILYMQLSGSTITDINFLQQHIQKAYEAIAEANLLYYLKNDSFLHLKKAFEYSEKRKTIRLLYAARDINAKMFSNIPIELINQELALKKEIKLLKRQGVQNGKDIQKIHKLEEELSAVIAQYPEKYRKLKYDFSTILLENTQAQLDDNQTLIEYFVADSVYAFIITPKMTKVMTITSTDGLKQQISDYKNNLLRLKRGDDWIREKQKYVQQSLDLYQRIFEPLMPYIQGNRLVIIPDKMIWNVPFESLITKPVSTTKPINKQSYKNYAYLLKKYSMSYNYSATLLNEMLKNLPKKNKDVFAGFAPNFERPTAWDTLHSNRQEVKDISQLLGGRAFLNENASKSNFLKEAPHYRFLHFASHAKADTSNGNNSFIVLQNGVDKFDSLFTDELYDIQLPAELVSLGVCESADGSFEEGEGVISLTRGFTYAGARSIVATNWQTRDKTSSEIMPHFYKNIKEGMPKDSALQLAKLAYLKHTATPPLYWAGFMLIGDMESVVIAEPFSYLFWIKVMGFLVLLIGMIGFYRIRKKRRSYSVF